jgi:hypothetical protein
MGILRARFKFALRLGGATGSMCFRTADRGKLIKKLEDACSSCQSENQAYKGEPCCACGFDSEVALKCNFHLARLEKDCHGLGTRS